MCNLMARCITYFTMLVELLIIKNVKAVGVMLSTAYSSLRLYILFNMCLKAFALFGKNKAYICAAAEMETLTLVVFVFIKSQLTCSFIQKLHVSYLAQCMQRQKNDQKPFSLVFGLTTQPTLVKLAQILRCLHPA